MVETRSTHRKLPRPRAQERLAETDYRLQALLEVSRELARAQHEQAIFRIALGTMIGAVGAQEGVALSLAPEDGAVSLASAQGGVEGEEVLLGFPAEDLSFCEALRYPLPARAGSRHSHAGVRAFSRRISRRGLRLWIPLAADGQLLGGACLGPRLTGERYDRSDLRLLATIAAHCAASIQGYRLWSANLLAQQQKFHAQALLEEHVDPQIAAVLLGAEELPSQRCAATILVADLRGFTSSSEQLQPEEVVEVLNRFLARMTRVVGLHGGIVDKFIGDAVMAYFKEGAVAAQAAACALAMQRAFSELRPTPAGPFPDVFAGGMGIGISTGEVVWGQIGSARRQDFTVIGTPVNLAHRLSAVAAGGTLADARTVAEAGPGVAAIPLPPVAIKGLSHPVEVYELLGGSPPRDGSADPAARMAPECAP